MSLVSLVILLIVLGVILYLITLLPIDGRLKQIAQGLIILIAIIWLIQTFFSPLSLGTHRIG